MKEIYYATTGWMDIEDNAFESREECEAWTKEMLTRRLGEKRIQEELENDIFWLEYQFDIVRMDYHPKGQY